MSLNAEHLKRLFQGILTASLAPWCSRLSRLSFGARWYPLGVLAWWVGCGSAGPDAPPACPTVVPGFETFACNLSELSGLALGTDDVFWSDRSTASGANDQGVVLRQSKAGGEPIVLA